MKYSFLITLFVLFSQNEGSLNLKYKDLVSNFEKVLENKAKRQSGNSQFPVTLGINAFQGFLNEYMQVHKPSNNSSKKVSSWFAYYVDCLYVDFQRELQNFRSVPYRSRSFAEPFVCVISYHIIWPHFYSDVWEQVI